MRITARLVCPSIGIRRLLAQWATSQCAALHSSGDIQCYWSANYQWDAKESHFLRLALESIAFSDRELAEVFVSGVEVI
jgi:hypothetical protein